MGRRCRALLCGGGAVGDGERGFCKKRREKTQKEKEKNDYQLRTKIYTLSRTTAIPCPPPMHADPT